MAAGFIESILHKSAAILRAIIDASPPAITALDDDGIVRLIE